MSKPPYKFRERLDKAAAFGTDVFLKWYPDAVFTDGRRGDLIINNQLVELKTDFYPRDTGNIFMETHSRYPDKPGGPWQAKEHGCDLFVYCFAKKQQVWWFELDLLLRFLDNSKDGFPERFVQNIGYSGRGLLVPKETLRPIAYKVDIFALATTESERLGSAQAESQELLAQPGKGSKPRKAF